MTHPIRKKYSPAVGELVFWPVFILLMAAHGLESTTLIYTQPQWMTAVRVLRYLLYGILLVKAIFLTARPRKELWWLLSALAVALVCWGCSGELQLVEWAIIIFAARDLPRQKLAYSFLLVKAIGIALTLLLHELGILPTMYSGPTYNTTGFCDRNVLGTGMVILCIGWFYLRSRRFDAPDIVFWAILATVTFLLTLSLPALLTMVATLFLMCLFRKLERPMTAGRWAPWLCVGLFAAMLLVGISLPLIYQEGSSLWDILDTALHGGLSHAHRIWEEFGLSLFGQKLPLVPTIVAQTSSAPELILDNSYVRALVQLGIVPGLLLLGLFAASLWSSCKKGQLALTAGLLAVALLGIFDHRLLDAAYDLPLLLGLLSLFPLPETEAQ